MSNIFSSFEDANIAQIYCSGEQPENSVCQKYFQISDAMLVTKQKGRRLEEKDYSSSESDETSDIEGKLKERLTGFLREPALLAREFLWTLFNFRTPELETFIKEFKPDVIFAPCYSYYHVSKLALYVKSIADCPMISYISDDNYSIRQFRFSPSFWINRLITRKWIRRHFSQCSLVYTMTQLQKEEYEELFGIRMKVLCKAADFSEQIKEPQSPIKIIYAGGLYLNRWKILGKVAKALEVINQSHIKAQLHIYSASKLSEKQSEKLNDGRNSFLHGAVPYTQLKEKYDESDIAVHVESFDLKNRCITRLSFSTKIIDCMNSGCAILAIGPKSQAGIAYLKDNDAAVCINDTKSLLSTIDAFVSNPSLIKEYAQKANELGMKNHMKANIDKMLKEDFADVVNRLL
ncbi:MAG: hypothetical protein IJ015_01380 [Ruminococcus sp.]|nr:hypothetical protein [Ruminococcus sp.]